MTQRYTGQMHLKPASRVCVLALFCAAFSLPALAQWQWIDKDGRKVFSDRSPPTDIADNKILKRPGGSSRLAAAPESDNPAQVAAVASSPVAGKPGTPKLPVKDAQLEAKKKQAEDEEAAKKKTEEDKVAKGKADNCDRAKKGIASMQGGGRIAITNAKGEREIMDDSARAAETKRLQAIAESNCG